MNVSVVIPARDAETTLRRTLDAIRAQTVQPSEVIVVDDASSDATPELIAQAGALHIRHESPRGAGAARNAGVLAATGDAIAFTDADCFPTPAWLERGLAALERCDLVQGAVEPDPSADHGPYQKTLHVPRPNPYFPTANVFVRRELFDVLGGFEDWIRGPGDAPLRAPHGEDTLFGWEAMRRGARIAFASDALVHHAVFPQSRTDWVRSHWNARHQPVAARRIPELRESAFFRHWFYRRRTALFDCALTGGIAAAATRRPWLLVAALPYARMVAREARRYPGHGYAAARVGADAVTAAALAWGSLRSRTPVL